MRLFVALYLLLLLGALCVPVLIIGLRNLAVVEGENMTITCQTNSKNIAIEWEFYPIVVDKNTPKQQTQETFFFINRGPDVKKEFSEFTLSGNPKGQFLTVDYARLKHAGLYKCTSNGRRTAAELIVLDSNPECNTKKTLTDEHHGYMDMVCTIVYRGHMPPEMEWRLEGREHKNASAVSSKEIREISIIDPTLNTLTSTLRVAVNTNSHRFSCATFFKAASSARYSFAATNAPEYNFTWISPAVNAFYGPRNVKVTPNKQIFYPDDRLVCSADCNPDPDFEWRDVETEEVVRGQVLFIRSSWIRDRPYIFRCTARNPMTNAENHSDPITLTVKEMSESVAGLTVAVTVGAPGLNVMLTVSVSAAALFISIAIVSSLSIYIVVTRRRSVAAGILRMESNTDDNMRNGGTMTYATSAYNTPTTAAVSMMSTSINLNPVPTSTIYPIIENRTTHFSLPFRSTSSSPSPPPLSSSPHRSLAVESTTEESRRTGYEIEGRNTDGSYEEIELDDLPSSSLQPLVEENPMSDDTVRVTVETMVEEGRGGSNEENSSTRVRRVNGYMDLGQRDPAIPSVYAALPLSSRNQQETRTA